jgi:hypothetical protein
MKRLLAYLFIVLGLGLTFSVSAKAKLVFCEVRFITFEGEIIQAGQGGNYRKKYDVEPVYFANNKCYFAHDSYSGKRADHPQISLENYVDQVLNYRIRVGKSSVSNYYSVPLNVGKSLIKEFEKNKIDTSYLISVLENQHRVAKKDLEITKQTQIAQAEPSQTKKVTKNKTQTKKFNVIYNAYSMNFNIFNLGNTTVLFLDNGKCKVSSNIGGIFRNFKYKGNQQVRCKWKYGISQNDKVNINFGYGINNIIEKMVTFQKDLNGDIYAIIYDRRYPLKVTKEDPNNIIRLAKKYDVNEYLSLINKKQQTQIAKAEPTIKPKKKVKVAKKEPKQEEFKPKKTNQDDEAPVIQITEAITVDSQAYTLKGKVKDKSQIYLTINGRQVDVKKGKFQLDRFSIDPDVAEELKIVAIDQWNNKSEKIVKVTIDLQSTDIAKVYEELKPNNIKVKTDKNKIAIIIGIEKYENLTNLDAKYANRDAKAFRTYATRALGIKPSNIKMLIDDKATRSQALKAFKLWLPKIAGKGGKDIHIFFAGHGLASDNGEDLYILPQDGESSLLEDTAISRVELISLINKVNPRSVTMFFDTCYSGQTRDERMLVASLRPIRIVADEQEKPDNFTIFTASNYDQTSGSIEEAQHGMFSYYLMKGLEGKADENDDRKITNGELITYLKDNVSQEAFMQNREQDPMLAGDPDKVLMSYR